MIFRNWLYASVVLASCSLTASATVVVTVFTTPLMNSAQVGTTVHWMAAAYDSSDANAPLLYQFSVENETAGKPSQILRDYSSDPTFAWTPPDQEGTYWVLVTALNPATGSTGFYTGGILITTRLSDNFTPVVSATKNPLVALYSFPSCPVGESGRVRFKATTDTVWQSTTSKPCTGFSMNFYVAGMRPSTTYQLQHDVLDGAQVSTPNEALTFTTGVISISAIVPATNIVQAASAPNSTVFPVVLTFPTGEGDPVATDVNNNVIWYLPGFETNGGNLYRAIPGGTFIGAYDDQSGINNRHLLREWDLAGNVVRELSVTSLNLQLTAVGEDKIISFSHDAYRFPNGDTALIASVERLNVNQGAGSVNVLGDMVIVVDSNLQLKWWWNEFEHIPITQTAVLGETCTAGVDGCPVLLTAGSVNDWTHSNSIAPTPDGNLVISIRHQDMAIKLNYQNGTIPAWKSGQTDNTMMWTFGNRGIPGVPAFTTTATDSNDSIPWPTHQHDVEFQPNGELTVFDNGNTRIAQFGGDSRGQAWLLNESNLRATRIFNQDLGVFAQATGAAELLSNGNYHFHISFDPSNNSKTVEYDPSGSLQFVQAVPSTYDYRSFRMASLYSEYPSDFQPVQNAEYTVTPAAAGQYFVPITPCRLVDTRNANGAFVGPSLVADQARSFSVPQGFCGIPVTATAYSINVTAVPQKTVGFLTVWPDGQPQPVVSTLNSWDGRVKANAAIVPAGAADMIDVYSTGNTDVILDVNGYFAPVPGLQFYPTSPCRVFDSRSAAGPFGGPSLAANQTREVAVQQSACSVPSTARAYSLNITAIPNSGSLGYLTTWPSGSSQPYVSTLNSYTGVTTANAAIVPAGTSGDISVFVSNPADVVVDINGYFAAPSSGSDGLLLYPLPPCRVLDTREGAGAFKGVLSPTFNESCGVPSASQGLVLNATVVPVGPLGYLSLWEAGSPQPYVSTLNSYDGSVTSNMAIVPANSGAIEAYASDATELILDVSASFAP